MKDMLNFGIFNMISTPSDTELVDFIEEVLKTGEKYPEIYKRIEEDQRQLGLAKKKLRIADNRYEKDQSFDLSGFSDFLMHMVSDYDLNLYDGRPRIRPELVLLFMELRGYWGSISDRQAYERINDSMTLYILFSNLGLKLPGATTILENINCVTNETREYILRCQLERIREEQWDDFKYVIVDSTAVEANSSWPTDAGIILKLLKRCVKEFKKLDEYGIHKFSDWYTPCWLETLQSLYFKINTAKSASKCAKKKRLRKLYNDYLKICHRMYEYLTREFHVREIEVMDKKAKPSVYLVLRRLWLHLEEDILALCPILYYTEERVFNDVQMPSTEKILSVSDVTAAFIKKGQRNPVIGYKPELCKSGSGFISASIIKQGNISDSEHLFPLVQSHTENTGVVPEFIVGDDGFSSKKGVRMCHDFGVPDVCLSGGTARLIIPDELWQSAAYQLGRRQRSAVESMIFTLKYVFSFGELRRRGLENVKAEMLEKVIAYNFCRIIQLREAPKALKKAS